jgi:Protein of unknown function (DUF1353)
MTLQMWFSFRRAGSPLVGDLLMLPGVTWPGTTLEEQIMRLLGFVLTLLLGIGIGAWAYLNGKIPAVFRPMETAGTVVLPAGTKNVFKNNVVAEFLAPKKAMDTYRDIKLIQSFGYIDPRGVHWDAPAGYVTNGASIPPSLWAVVGGPFDGPYRDAAVLHDYYCEAKLRSSDDTHRMYYEAAVARGTSENIASTMYAGIVFGGPKWEVVPPKKAGFGFWFAQSTTATTPSGATVKVDPGLTHKDATAEQLKAVEEMKAWIAREKPTVEQIQKRAEELRKSTGVTKQ